MSSVLLKERTHVNRLTPLAKITLISAPLLPVIFIVLKLAGPLASWSWWWAPGILTAVVLVAIVSAIWLDIAMMGEP
jgi:hypothetical protein